MEKEEYQRLYELEDELWWFVGMRQITLTLINRFLTDSRGLLILDAGCGTGGMLHHLHPFGKEIGLDISDEALRFAGLRENTRLIRASVSCLPFDDNTFDLVTSFDVIYHKAVERDEETLAESLRVLRADGTLLIRVPAYNWMRSSHDEAVHTGRRYTRGGLDKKLRRAGFRPIYLTYANSLLFPVAVAYRFLGKLRPHRRNGSDVGPIIPSLNRWFGAALKLEAGILRHSRLPFGLSLIALAQKAE